MTENVEVGLDVDKSVNNSSVFCVGRGSNFPELIARFGRFEYFPRHTKHTAARITVQGSHTSHSTSYQTAAITDDNLHQIADCCYKLLERQETVKCKKTLESVLHVLAILIKRYNHSIGRTIKLNSLTHPLL